jgi:hypothetical protein
VVTYRIDKTGTFITTNYQESPTWSSFFPGIAGTWGTPLWAFYINRGQAIAGFGTRSKDEPIMEYWPANKAYQIAPSQGFRTFLKVRSGKGRPIFYEPFSTTGGLREPSITSEMRVRSHEIEIVERHKEMGLEVQVRYFTMPGEAYPALVREVTLTNRGRLALDLDLLDGLAVIFPYGVNNWFLKEMSRTIEAWMTVDTTRLGVPLFRLSTDPGDVAEVSFVKGGNFYLAFEEGASVAQSRIIFDPRAVFGPVTDLSVPWLFARDKVFKFPRRQIACNVTPCALMFWNGKLAAGASKRFFALAGHVFSAEDIERVGLTRLNAAFLDRKRVENERIVSRIQDRVFMASGDPLLDLYARQTFLDNVLRGGLPVTVGAGRPEKIAYVYSRKHGDLERDYNRFQVAPTYFSKGEGNYRDVNQNRRCDVFFEPKVGAKNLCEFMNLVQLDGYNPLVFRGERYRVSPDDFLKSPCAARLAEKEAHKVAHLVGRDFEIGELLRAMEEGKMRVEGDRASWIAGLIGMAEVHEDAAHGEGYWVDHWTYNIDLLESFAAVFPDRVRRVLFEEVATTYYDTHVFVKPRSEKNVLHHGDVRRHHALFSDEEKSLLIQKRAHDKHRVRTRNGEGDVLRTTLIAKFVCLIANKAATLDPQGIGIEMEADKPGWYDALNGLPALFGSSVCETMEIKRLCSLLANLARSSGIEGDFEITLPNEVAVFVEGLEGLLASTPEPFAYWEGVGRLKETYRGLVRRGVSGEMKVKRWSELSRWLDAVGQRCDVGIDRAIDPKTGEIATYFAYSVVRYEQRPDPSGHAVIHPLAFEGRRLPLFLEGFVHALRARPHSALSFLRSLRKSALYDKKLGMFRVNASLENEPFEIGRAKAFTPGWLENGSIWLHMEYKLMLEILRSGNAAEFYEAFGRMLIPYQKASVYSRSPLEGSSFIVSSAHPDPTLHGRGFVARLSGSTVEFLHMWMLMNVGAAPFSLDEKGGVVLRLRPCLPASLFTRKSVTRSFTDADGRERSLAVPADSMAFLFLGRVVVLYRNARRKDTFGPRAVQVKRMVLKDNAGRVQAIEGDVIMSPWAAEVRDGLWTTIEVTLG